MPLPNCMPHRPSTRMRLPLASRSEPSHVPVRGPYALIVPSPKLPTSSAPPNLPKLAGASARPHGAFNAPREATQQAAVRIEHIHEAEALALHFLVAALVLFRIGDIDVAVDRLDAERCVVRG